MNQIVINDFEKKYNKFGYTLIKVNGKFVLEHKYIVESFLNRKLTKEVIHHINGIKSDNSLVNLMLFDSQKEHAHFHRQIKQFGFTQPRRTEISNNLIQVKLKEQSVFK